MILSDYNFAKAKEIRHMETQAQAYGRLRHNENVMIESMRTDLDSSVRIAEIVHDEVATIH